MGIHGLNPFCKKVCADAFSEIALEDFSGKIILIDYLNWLFTYLSISNKILVENQIDPLEELSQEKIKIGILTQLSDFICTFLEHKITIAFVGDGISQDNKGVTKIERKKEREKAALKAENAKETLLKQNPLERDPVLLDEYIKLKSRSIKVNSSTFSYIEEFIKNSGIKFIKAEDEAENLIASMSKERKIAGGWTSDTDFLPLEGRLMVKGFVKKNGKCYIKSVNTYKIRSSLGLDCQAFRDFCILLGTDFNERIPGIGPTRALKIIKEYGNLDRAQTDTKHDIANLKHIGIRKQLTPYETKYNREDLEIDINKKIEIDDDLFEQIPSLVKMFSKIKRFGQN